MNQQEGYCEMCEKRISRYVGPLCQKCGQETNYYENDDTFELPEEFILELANQIRKFKGEENE